MENPDEWGVDLTRCCYADLRGGTYRLAVLPWGATEPHNLHLPYLTDCLLAQSLAVDAAARLWRERRVRAVVLPPVTLGAQNPGQWDKLSHRSDASTHGCISDVSLIPWI